ncbi:MAG: Uma2 family endonuclease [Chthonomonadetes bacterium]|nr:Uma2 family endonuclease [Chthonomonadetes bacterium]
MATESLKTSTRPLPKGKLSYEQFLQWLDEDTWAEWVDGEVILMSPISDEHQLIVSYLTALLETYASTRGTGIVLTEPFQMKSGADLPGRSPDILFVASSRQHLIQRHFLDGPADLVVEIISPESRARDRGEKYYEYERAGVKEYWIVDPERKQVEFYVLSEQGIYRPAFMGGAGEYHSTAVEGFWIRVEWLWERPAVLEVLRVWGWVP